MFDVEIWELNSLRTADLQQMIHKKVKSAGKSFV
jgi:hypothetical protein